MRRLSIRHVACGSGIHVGAGYFFSTGDGDWRSDRCDRIRDDARARGVAIERRGVRAG